MHMKRLLALLLASFLVFGAAACGSDSDEKSSDEKSSSAEESTDEESTDEEATDEEATDEESTDEEATDEDTSTDDMDIPDMGDLGDCLEVAGTYGSILMSVLGSDEDLEAALGELDSLGGSIPEDLQDDLDVIAEGLADADGIVEAGEFMESDEFVEADANIQAYLEDCGS